MIVAAIFVWAALAGAVSVGFVYFLSKRVHRRRQEAYREFLEERGIEMRPDDTVRGTIVRSVPSVTPTVITLSTRTPMRPKARAVPPRPRRERTAFTDFNVPNSSPNNRSGFIEIAGRRASFGFDEPPTRPLPRLRKA